MSDLRKQLIRMGNSQPRLRPHLRPILASLQYTAAPKPGDKKAEKMAAAIKELEALVVAAFAPFSDGTPTVKYTRSRKTGLVSPEISPNLGDLAGLVTAFSIKIEGDPTTGTLDITAYRTAAGATRRSSRVDSGPASNAKSRLRKVLKEITTAMQRERKTAPKPSIPAPASPPVEFNVPGKHIHDDAAVYGNAKVYDGAWVYGNAKVYGHAEVYGNAKVYGYKTIIQDNAKVYGNAEVYGNAKVGGKAKVYDRAWVYDDAQVAGNAQVYGKAAVSGRNVIIRGNAKVYGHAEVSGRNIHITGNADIGGTAVIRGGTWDGSEGPVMSGRWKAPGVPAYGDYDSDDY